MKITVKGEHLHPTTFKVLDRIEVEANTGDLGNVLEAFSNFIRAVFAQTGELHLLDEGDTIVSEEELDRLHDVQRHYNEILNASGHPV